MKFKVILSGDHDGVRVLEDEIPKVIEAARTNDLAVLKHGVINGTYFVDIKRDKEAERKEWKFANTEDEIQTAFDPFKKKGDKKEIASPDDE